LNEVMARAIDMQRGEEQPLIWERRERGVRGRAAQNE
jgi:hypothetical protein